MRHKLSGIDIEAPNGIEGMYFEKTMNPRFFSILSRNTGRVRGTGQVDFVEPIAVQVLNAAWEADKVDAVVNYEMIDDTGTTLIDSAVNFANHRRRPAWWSVTFRDSEQMNVLELQADKVVAIMPSKEVLLESVKLAQEITHNIDTTLLVYSWKVAALAKDMAHYPAFKAQTTKADSTGDFASVINPSKAQPIWINTTANARTVEVTARLVVAHRSATASVGTLALYVVNGTATTTYPIMSVSVGTSLETKTYAINQVLTIPQGGQLYLQMQSFNNTSADFAFAYDSAKSYLCVNQDRAVPSSTAKVISCFDAIKAICSQIAPNITLKNEVADLNTDWVTNGYQLRGVKTAPIKISFGALWDDLNKLHNLMLHRTAANQLTIKKKVDFLAGLGSGIELQSTGNYEIRAGLDLFYNRVLAGFQQWQSYTPTGNEEQFGSETYTTNLQQVDSRLNLMAAVLCASEKLIEVVRRTQFDVGGSSANADGQYDEDIFIKGRAIKTSDSLNNWADFWAVSSNTLTKLSGMPDNSAKNVTGVSRFFTGDKIMVEGTLSGEEWAEVSDVVSFTDGGISYRVLVDTASYYPGAAGSGSNNNTTIEGWVLK